MSSPDRDNVVVAADSQQYDLPTDENGRAKVIKIFSFKRPHMRAFHFAWSSFFLAFFGWFALAPLQTEIKKDNAWLSQGSRFKTQNIVAVGGTILMRFAIGPFCDRFGPRVAQSLLIGIFSIPVFLVSTAHSFWQWTTARFFIGFIGATFVVTQFWTSIMFSGNIVGTANATSAGWGNLGGGVTQAVMPQIKRLMEITMSIPSEYDVSPLSPEQSDELEKFLRFRRDRAWRLAMIWPGTALIILSVCMFLFSDDLPQGRYGDLHKAGTKEKTNPFKAFGRAMANWRSWVLFALYAGCFGIELIMNGNLADYFQTEEEPFGLSQGKAGLVASLFGLMNLFARSLGGIFSDLMAGRFGMRGRLWAFFIVEFIEGCMLVLFSRITVIGGAIPALIGFSLMVQMAEGATFGIVPFVDPPVTGAISGIVGAGGNAGAVLGNLLISPKKKNGISNGFRNLGFIVMGCSLLVATLWWPQYGSMFTKPTTTAKVIDDDDDDEAEVNVQQATEMSS